MTNDDMIREFSGERGLAVAGTNERALCREDALIYVSLLAGKGKAILGGDVYYVRDSRLEPAYSNWHLDPDADESEAEFVARSCDAAIQYIQEFPERQGNLPVFVIVAATTDEEVVS